MTRQLPILPGTNGAEFSPCRTWRYALWRLWDDRLPKVAFVGLNPSTADETANDPTIRRCIDFAKRWEYGGLYMLNIFAYRATDPRDMKSVVDPDGPGNDLSLRRWCAEATLIVAAWGNHGMHRSRCNEILDLGLGRLFSLGETKHGQPKHPLYLSQRTEPRFWREHPHRLR